MNWKEESHISRIRWALKVFYTEWMKWDEKEGRRKRQRKRQRKKSTQNNYEASHFNFSGPYETAALIVSRSLANSSILFWFETFQFSILAIITHSHTVCDYLMPHLNWQCFFCVLYECECSIAWFLIFKTVCNLSIDYNFMKESTRLLYEVIVGVRLVESFSWI